MTNWHQRLKAAYQNKKDATGITQSDIAGYMGVSQATIANWIAGRRQPVGLDEYRKLAAYLDVDPTWLMNGEDSSGPSSNIPLLLPSQIKPWISGSNIDTKNCKSYSLHVESRDKLAYATIATDSGMEPRVCVGDTVFLSPTPAPAPGATIALDFRDDGYLTIGRLITAGRRYALAMQSGDIDITVDELSSMYRGTVIAVLMPV